MIADNPTPQHTWADVEGFVKQRFGKEITDLKAVLFIIGFREMGRFQRKWKKEAKQDLMNLAMCRVMSLGGYFEKVGQDADGWPHWQQRIPLPVTGQEELIKQWVVVYFEEEGII